MKRPVMYFFLSLVALAAWIVPCVAREQDSPVVYWQSLSESAKKHSLVSLLAACNIGKAVFVRNRIDEGFRFNDLDKLDEKTRKLLYWFVENGFNRLEILGSPAEAPSADRIYCYAGATTMSLRSGDGEDKDRYLPKILATDEPMLVFFNELSLASAIEKADACCQNNDERQVNKQFAGIDSGARFMSFIPGCAYRIEVQEFENTDSFSRKGLISSDMISPMRQQVKKARKLSGLVTLTRREVSELLLVLLGENEYCSRVADAKWLSAPEDMTEITTELGKALRFYKTHEKEYKDLCDEVANMQHKRGVAR